MAGQASEVEALERILSDASADPARLAYGLIKSITNDFSKEIGRGAFGVVYLGTLPNGMVAVKKLSVLQDFSDDRYNHEVDCLLKTKHSNIVRFLGYCADTQGELVEHKGRKIMAEVRQRLLCFEYVPNRSLRHYIKEKPHGNEWKTRYGMMKGICQGLQYLHKERINHLDLKPENVLLGAGMEPKITDFGLSRCFDEDHSRTFVQCTAGTRGYIAPEMIEKGEISFKSDIFSLGVIFINLLTGSDNNGDDNWHNSIDVDGPEVEICIEIARTCVEFDQHKRPSIYEINHRLNEMESVQEARNNQRSSIYQACLSASKKLPPSVSLSCIDNQDCENTKMESTKQDETSYASGMGHPREDRAQYQQSSIVTMVVPPPQPEQIQVNGLNAADSRMRDAKSVKLDGESDRDDGIENDLHHSPEMAMNAVAGGMPVPRLHQDSGNGSIPAGMEHLQAASAAGGSMAHQECIALIQNLQQQIQMIMLKGGHGGTGHVPPPPPPPQRRPMLNPMTPHLQPSQVKPTPPGFRAAVCDAHPSSEDDDSDSDCGIEFHSGNDSDSDCVEFHSGDEDLSAPNGDDCLFKEKKGGMPVPPSARGGGNEIPPPISKNDDQKLPTTKNENQNNVKNAIPPPISNNVIPGQTNNIGNRGEHPTGGNHPGIVTPQQLQQAMAGNGPPRWGVPQQQYVMGNRPPGQMGGNGWAGERGMPNLCLPQRPFNEGCSPPVPQVSAAAENSMAQQHMAYMQMQHVAYMQQQQLAFYYQSSFLLACVFIIIVLVVFQVPVNRYWE